MSADTPLGAHRRADHVVAALVTATLPTAIAAIVIWLLPRGCDLRGDPATYRWTCLLPGLLLTVAPVTALVLGLGGLVGSRLAGWIAEAPIATAVLWGLLVHLFLVGSLLVNDPGYVSIFLWEVLLIPQPIVAGALAAGTHVIALHWRLRRASG